MVEAMGSKPVSLGDRMVAPVARAVAATPARPVAAEPNSSPAVAGVARALAATPPVDLERVARIRKAISDGNFPILPATVADRLLAFSLDWKSDDHQA